MYEIRCAGAKGLGVFAQIHIPRGTRIFSERPLLSITHSQNASDIFTASQLLAPKKRNSLLDLSSHTTKELSVLRFNQALWYTFKNIISSFATFNLPKRPALGEHVKILSIFRSNAFNLGGTSSIRQAVFERISRINHSCLPNAQGNFHEGLGKFNVHATRDIEADEELTLNYLHERGAIRASRLENLKNGYGFLCQCPACDMDSKKAVLGEEARVKMLKILGEYAEGAKKEGLDGVEAELVVLKAFLSLLEGEGIAGREVSVLYFEAAKLSKKLGNCIEALDLAERGLIVEKDCLGEDHLTYQDSSDFVEDLKDQILSLNKDGSGVPLSASDK